MNAAAAPRRAFRPVHEVADKAGEVSVVAEVRLGEEINKVELAKGTRGQFRGRKKGAGRGKGGGKGSSAGGTVLELPAEEITLRDLGISRKRSARSKRLAEIPLNQRTALIEGLKRQGKAVSPDSVVAAYREDNKRKRRAEVAAAVFSADGPFDVVVMDPPWDVEKIDREVRPNQDAFDYPVMTVDEIERFWQREMARRISGDCHLFLWTTQKYLPEAIALVGRLDSATS
jgi:hypothetical protein